jgi:hypothetical protein
MRWMLGLRLATVYFDSRATLVTAPADVGVLSQQRVSNYFWGGGPRVALELAQRLEGTWLGILLRVDADALLGRVNQNFSETFTSALPGGPTQFSGSQIAGGTSAPVVNLQLGINWMPPFWPETHFFVGYQGEHWWNVGRQGDLDNHGELIDQGIVLRGSVEF